MDTSKDRIWLHTGMTIMMIKEVVQFIIESALILAYLSGDAMGFEYALYFVIVGAIFHLIALLLYLYWKMSLKSYYEQLADYEAALEQ